MNTNDTSRRGRWYWENFTPDDPYAGADLAALRKGLGREAGDVPQMWRFYRSVTSDGATSRRLTAEHAALALFALHQQSRRTCMHHPGTGLGLAARYLRLSGKHNPEGVDRRMQQVATATDVEELIGHLRGLVTLLRSIDQPLDYTQLRQEIERWHFPERQPRIRSHWGSDYFDWRSSEPREPNAT